MQKPCLFTRQSRSVPLNSHGTISVSSLTLSRNKVAHSRDKIARDKIACVTSVLYFGTRRRGYYRHLGLVRRCGDHSNSAGLRRVAEHDVCGGCLRQRSSVAVVNGHRLRPDLRHQQLSTSLRPGTWSSVFSVIYINKTGFSFSLQ